MKSQPRQSNVIPLPDRFTRAQVEEHLARELVHWLPAGGEAGNTPDERQRTAAAAAKIIAGRLTK